jgi:hypothetical protein
VEDTGTEEVAKWVQRYEDLRQQILAEPAGGGWGRVLLLRRGLVAWMQAWPADARTAPLPSPAAGEATRLPGLPTDLSLALTRVLLDLILDTERSTAYESRCPEGHRQSPEA